MMVIGLNIMGLEILGTTLPGWHCGKFFFSWLCSLTSVNKFCDRTRCSLVEGLHASLSGTPFCPPLPGGLNLLALGVYRDLKWLVVMVQGEEKDLRLADSTIL